MKQTLLILCLSLILVGCSSAVPTHVFPSDAPQLFICQEDDLPGSYILIEDLSGAKPNENLIINSEYPEESERYIQATERLEGWEHRFVLGEMNLALPGFFLCQVVVYESNDGANQALEWPHVETREIIESDRSIGDEMTLTVLRFDAPDGSPWIDHRVEFVYHNILGAVSTYAPLDVANQEFSLDLAEILFLRMSDETSSN